MYIINHHYTWVDPDANEIDEYDPIFVTDNRQMAEEYVKRWDDFRPSREWRNNVGGLVITEIQLLRERDLEQKPPIDVPVV